MIRHPEGGWDHLNTNCHVLYFLKLHDFLFWPQTLSDASTSFLFTGVADDFLDGFFGQDAVGDFLLVLGFI